MNEPRQRNIEIKKIKDPGWGLYPENILSEVFEQWHSDNPYTNPPPSWLGDFSMREIAFHLANGCGRITRSG